MPSSSTISSSDKSKVKSTLPSSSNKILTATVARVFVAYPSRSSWSYTGVEGALAFVRDLDRNTFVFKVIDLKGSKGVLWEHELYEPLVYSQDRTFFHTLESDEYMIGFAFADDGEAAELHKKINNRQKFAKGSSSSSSKKKRGSKLLSGKGGKIDKSMIGAPSDFKHVAHMGYTAEKGFSAENVDPSWSALLDQLSNMGISRADIQKNEGFIKDFVGKRGGVPPTSSSAAAKAPSKVKKVPPPAPSRAGTTARKQPPPPPAPRTRPGAASAAAPPPPPPPARSAATTAAAPPPPPPPPPARGGNAATAAPPPPPPPPPARGGAAAPPPPPPPPPPAGGAGAPPPPPPPPPSAPASGGLPSAQPGRANLLASIQGQSVHNLRKVDPAAAATGGAAAGAAGAGAAYAATPDDSAGGDSGADLASALAAALSARKDNMGDSDEDGESEEEW